MDTPPDEDGPADLQHVLAVARTIGIHLKKLVSAMPKSNVTVCTADKVHAAVDAAQQERSAEVEFDIVSKLKFLYKGSAIVAFMKPYGVVIGGDQTCVDARAARALHPTSCARPSSNRLLPCRSPWSATQTPFP